MGICLQSAHGTDLAMVCIYVMKLINMYSLLFQIVIGLIGILGVVTSAYDVISPYPPDDKFGTPADTYGLPVQVNVQQFIPPPPALPPLDQPSYPISIGVDEEHTFGLPGYTYVLPEQGNAQQFKPPSYPISIGVDEVGEIVEIIKKPAETGPHSNFVIENVKYPPAEEVHQEVAKPVVVQEMLQPGFSYTEVKYPQTVIPQAPELPPLNYPIKVVVDETYTPPIKSETVFKQNYVTVIDTETSQPAFISRPIIAVNQKQNSITVVDKETTHPLFISRPVVAVEQPKLVAPSPIIVELLKRPDIFYSHKVPVTDVKEETINVLTSNPIYRFEETDYFAHDDHVYISVQKPNEDFVNKLIYKNVPVSEVVKQKVNYLNSKSGLEIVKPRLVQSPIRVKPETDLYEVTYPIPQTGFQPQIVVQKPEFSFLSGLEKIKNAGMSFLKKLFSSAEPSTTRILVRENYI